MYCDVERTLIVFFNLIDEKFISTSDGLQSISDIFENAHNINRIECQNPLETLSMYRFLIPFVYRAYGIKTEAEWKNLWKKGKFGTEMQEYLSKWHDRFFLEHDKYPFFQDPTVKGKKQSVNKLSFLTDNDASLFSKDFIGTRKETPESLAIKIITYQLMSLTSGKGGKERRSNFHASAQRGLAIVLSGKNLFETILLNCPPYDERLKIISNENDCPTWEKDISFDEKKTSIDGYLDYLTQPSRRTFIIFNKDKTCSNVISEKGHDPCDSVKDPFIMYMKNKEDKWLPVQFRETEYLWKNFKSLSLSLKEDEAVIFKNNYTITLVDDEDFSFSYLWFGMHMDSKLTKFKCVVEYNMPVHVTDFIDSTLGETVCNVVEECEKVGTILNNSLFGFYKAINIVSSKEKYMYEFWDKANTLFQKFLKEFHSKNESAADNFTKLIRRLACDIYKESASQSSISNMTKYIEYMYKKNNMHNFYGKVYSKM